MRWRPLPLTNTEIVTRYAAGVSMADLTVLTRASPERLKGILHAYGIRIRGRSEATSMGQSRSAYFRWKRRRRCLAGLGHPKD
jgi:hypothetical protein